MLLPSCARNCFQCPQCDHTLVVTATDPSADFPANSTAASMGEAPYYLACNVCLWDSKHVGIQFDKPTGLARSFPLPSNLIKI